ncbi:unnamed protein product [Hanseniaspora opuntiae]
MTDASINVSLKRYSYIIDQSLNVPNRNFISVFFLLLGKHMEMGTQSDLDINLLYIYLNKVTYKLFNNNSTERRQFFFKKNEIQIIIQNIIQNRSQISDDYLIFQTLENILLLYKQTEFENDDTFYFQLVSLIVVKIVFKDFEKDSMPSSDDIRFLSTILLGSRDEVLSAEELHKIAPGIITKLIKVLTNNYKHDVKYFGEVLNVLTQTILKCKDHFSKNENVLIYQSLDMMINKSWSINYTSSNTKIDTLILNNFIRPMKDFELVSELLVIEYLYRYQSYSDDLQKMDLFDQYTITNLLCEKVKMIDVLYFDLKTFKIFKNGLIKLSQGEGIEKSLFYKQFNMFVEYGYTKPERNNVLNQKDVQLPSHIQTKHQIQSLTTKLQINERIDTFEQIDNQLLDVVLNNEIKAKWIDLVGIWKNLLTKADILNVLNDYNTTNDEYLNEKRTYLFYYIFFQKINSNSHSNPKQIAEQDIITQLDSINIDDFLVFSDDESTKDVVVEEEDDVLLEQCLQILDVSPNEAFSISNAYFICGYITSSLTPLSDLKDLETELIPLLLSNIDNPVMQHSLQVLSNRVYPSTNASLSFQQMIRENTDVILSHVSAIISSSSMSNQQMWIVFTKNVFQVCGIEVVSKADDVFNLMFEMMAMKSLGNFNDNSEITSVLELFGIVFDLIIDQYRYLIDQKSKSKIKRTSLKDALDLFKAHNYMYDSDDEIEEVNAVVPAKDKEVSVADEPSYTGEIPEHIYKLVVELLGYTERVYPLLSESSAKPYTVALGNVAKICLILNTSAKNYLPQLAQVIFPFVERIVKSDIFGLRKSQSKKVFSQRTDLIMKSAGVHTSHNIDQVLIINVVEILTLIIKQQSSFMFTRVSELYFGHIHGYVPQNDRVDHAMNELKAEMVEFVQSENGLIVKDRDIIKLL